MTFVIGFRCADGLVIATDSLESDGMTKRSVDKVKYFSGDDWGVVIAGAGGGGIVDKFCDEVAGATPREQFNPKVIETTIEAALMRYRSKYQEDEDHFRILVGVHRQNTYCRLYRSDATHLVPINDHAHIGMGHSLWRFLCENLYVNGDSVEDNSRLAVFIMNQAISYVDGVDEPVQLASVRLVDEDWKFRKNVDSWMLNQFLKPKGLPYMSYDVGPALMKFWKDANPPSRTDMYKKYGSFGKTEELIFLEGVATERFQTVSGRRKYEGFLYGNRDRLRKRGMLEKEQDEVKSDNQQP
jgi:20S proteasome alpha/beta subunit